MNRYSLSTAVVVVALTLGSWVAGQCPPAAQGANKQVDSKASAGKDSTANKLSAAEKKAGWKLLFDGVSTDGWRNYKAEGVNPGWQAIDGELRRAGNGAGDIITKDQFDSFEVSLEYKISPGGNSGLMFHVTEEAGQPWQTGPEVQIQDNVAGHDPQKSGWLYQLYPSEVDATRPAGEWNTIHLRVTPADCEINVNGLRYARFNKGSKEWDEKVAKSKFSNFPLFGKPTKGHICLQDHGNLVAFRNVKVRELDESGVPNPVDGQLPLKAVHAFPELSWADWEPINARGQNIPLRPIILTTPGDGGNRLFMATQQGVVHVFENDPQVKQSKVFLDLSDKVSYKDNENEEGLLGFAFHPKYKENGQFFIYYTSKAAPHTSIISRFKASGDDPNKADAAFEEELMRIEQPFWNHNGGTIAFGPDGYLYIGLGDGGAANDPFKNGQNLGTLLGSILRIDIDHKSAGLPYAIPSDNPFVDQKGARGEIWAYGLRNVWRLSFDRKTGTLWAGDVGQNLWEEINIIVKGGNYGWNLREATHPFGPEGSGPRTDLIEPIWEYDHQVGKSITGGLVYRGKKLPELAGMYVYADYVTGKIWALKYDADKKEVVSNLSIPTEGFPIISFGEDAEGEIYFMIVSNDGRGIYRFEPASN